jgi:hypothetical protein
MRRRDFCLLSAAVIASSRHLSSAEAQDADQLQFAPEPQRGDLDMPVETLSITTQQFAALNREVTSLAIPQPAALTGYVRESDRIFSEQVLKVAAAEIGVARSTKPDRVTEYLKLFGFGFKYSNGQYVPFCAVGAGWAVCKAYCDLAPLPTDHYKQLTYKPADEVQQFKSVFLAVSGLSPLSANCGVIQKTAQTTQKWWGADVMPRPGWLILYNWSGGKDPEHVGIVESATAASLTTIEFNTTFETGPKKGEPGVVDRKDRQKYSKYVLGYVSTY